MKRQVPYCFISLRFIYRAFQMHLPCVLTLDVSLQVMLWRGGTGTMTRPWGISALTRQASENCLNLSLVPSCEDTLCPPTLSGWVASATSRSRCPSPESNLALGLGLLQLQNHRNIFPLFSNMLQYFEIALYVNLGDVSTLGGFGIRKSWVSANSCH